jgi:hypothetical protein
VEFLLRAGSAGKESSLRVASVWTDFNVFGLHSDEWVTAYTACALAETGDGEALHAAHAAWDLLASNSSAHGPGLGYNTRAPQDADATLWGCRLAEAINRSSDEFARRSLELLQTLSREDGGIATFAPSVVNSINVNSMNTVADLDAAAGWTSSHTCVTAAAAWLPAIVQSADVIGYLSRTRHAQGFWIGYWWADAEYATAHALESLVRAGVRRELLDSGVEWLSGRVFGRSPFALALSILGISKAGGHSVLDLAVQKLIALQLADGSWPASARLRVPPPYLINPQVWWNWDERRNGIGGITVDQLGIFTTATALRALSACLTQ